MTKNRQVNVFRCYRDPMIPPKARNAFKMGDGPDQLPGTAEITTIGVLVKTKRNGDYLVPYANVESIHLLPEEVEALPTNGWDQAAEEKRKPGRPAKAV